MNKKKKRILFIFIFGVILLIIALYPPWSIKTIETWDHTNVKSKPRISYEFSGWHSLSYSRYYWSGYGMGDGIDPVTGAWINPFYTKTSKLRIDILTYELIGWIILLFIGLKIIGKDSNTEKINKKNGEKP